MFICASKSVFMREYSNVVEIPFVQMYQCFCVWCNGLQMYIQRVRESCFSLFVLVKSGAITCVFYVYWQSFCDEN